jgi:hypothetical protein
VDRLADVQDSGTSDALLNVLRTAEMEASFPGLLRALFPRAGARVDSDLPVIVPVSAPGGPAGRGGEAGFAGS